jgi:hypothetical protein
MLVIVPVYQIPRRRLLEDPNFSLRLWLHHLIQNAEFRSKFPNKWDLQFNLRVKSVGTHTSVTVTHRVS